MLVKINGDHVNPDNVSFVSNVKQDENYEGWYFNYIVDGTLMIEESMDKKEVDKIREKLLRACQ